MGMTDFLFRVAFDTRDMDHQTRAVATSLGGAAQQAMNIVMAPFTNNLSSAIGALQKVRTQTFGADVQRFADNAGIGGDFVRNTRNQVSGIEGQGRAIDRYKEFIRSQAQEGVLYSRDEQAALASIALAREQRAASEEAGSMDVFNDILDGRTSDYTKATNAMLSGGGARRNR